MKKLYFSASMMMLAAVAIISGCTMDTIEESFSPNDAEVSLTVNGGTITAIASGNDGIDSNGDLYFNGGVTAAYGAASPENGVDAAEGYSIYFNGGTLLCVGGSAITHADLVSGSSYTLTNGSSSSSVTAKTGSSSGGWW